MSTLTQRRVRAAVDTSKFDSPSDIYNNGVIAFWRSSDLRIDLGLYYGADWITDISELQSLTLQVKTPATGNAAPDPTASPLMSKTVTAFDGAATKDDWTAGTAQHATITFTGTETNIAPGDKWIILSAVLTGGETVTLAAGLCRVLEDGYNSAGSADVLTDTAWTKAEADARYAQGGNFAFVTAPSGKSDLTTLPGSVAPASGKTYLAIGPTGIWTIRHPETEWRFTDRSTI